MAARSYGPRQIQRAPMPGARLTAASTPLAEGAEQTAGEGLIAIGGQVARVGVAAFTGIAERERERADAIARLKWQNQFAEFEKTRINDPEKGALALQGEAAFPLPEQIDEEFGKLAGDIEAGLTTERQRLQFAQDRLTFGSSVEGTVRRHVRDQIQKFEGEQLTARVENARSAAGIHASDPRRVGMELTAGEQAIRVHGPKLGMPPEQVEREVAKFRSSTHIDVISSLLEDEQTQAARVYFEEANAAGEIAGDQVDGVKKALREGTVRKQSQTETARILAAGGTFTEQRDAAKKIADPDVQDEVLRRIEHEQAVKRNVDQDIDEQRMMNAANVVDKTRDLAKIPPAEWEAMSLPQKSGLRSYLKQITEGVDVETDFRHYYGLMQQAADDPMTFARVNLVNSIHKLGKTEFKQLADLQLSIRNADRNKTSTLLDGFMTNTQIVNDALLSAGLDPTPAPDSVNVDAVVNIRRQVDQQVQALQTRTGKKATNEDVQGIVDELLTSVTVTKGTGRIVDIFTSQPYSDVSKRLADVTLADMPAALKAQATDSLRRNGQIVSDTALLALYRRYLLSQQQGAK